MAVIIIYNCVYQLHMKPFLYINTTAIYRYYIIPYFKENCNCFIKLSRGQSAAQGHNLCKLNTCW